MNTYTYIIAGFLIVVLYTPVIYQVFMLRKDIKSLKKKTDKLVDWWYNRYRYATVAQRIEQLPSKQLATGSSPVGCIYFLVGDKYGTIWWVPGFYW